jgi:ABC-type branched-subunit amino acid transport system substrate-binding protein
VTCSTDVQAAVDTIVKAAPDAVIMIGAYKPCAAFIKQAKAAGMTNVLFLNVSFVGSMPLAQELEGSGDGVIVTQVVPLPWDTCIALVAGYQTHMQQYMPQTELGFGSLEGYLDAKAVDEVKQQKCRAHIGRAISEVLATKKGRARDVGERLKALPQDAMALWRAYHAGEVADDEAHASPLGDALTPHLRPRVRRSYPLINYYRLTLSDVTLELRNET